MRDDERKALSRLKPHWTSGLSDVWAPLDSHVEGLNEQVSAAVLSGFEEARNSDRPPLGVVVTGQNGVGKTHLLRWVRHQVQETDGYFFLISLHNSDFWRNVVNAYLDGLRRAAGGAEDQLTVLVRRLARWSGLPAGWCDQVFGASRLARSTVDEFVTALRRTDRRLGGDCQHTARALLMCAAEDLDAEDIASEYFNSQPEAVPGERLLWGIRIDTVEPHKVVRDISRLLAVTGPTMMAVDQVDALITKSASGADRSTRSENTGETPEPNVLLDELAVGLMDLRDITERSVTVVSCLPNSWELLTKEAVNTVRDRFRPEARMGNLPSANAGHDLVAVHFAARFREAPEFVPPYPSWPVLPEAFGGASSYTPRGLLRRINTHIQSCLDSSTIVELATLDEGSPVPVGPSVASSNSASDDELDRLDRRFESLVREADISRAVEQRSEDQLMPELLTAALRCWILERGHDLDSYGFRAVHGGRESPLHVQLSLLKDEVTGDEIRWSFRSVAAVNARTVQAQIKRAQTVGGLEAGNDKRRVFLLQPHNRWSTGPKTISTLRDFQDAGGVCLPVDPADLRVFDALRLLLAEPEPIRSSWLRHRRPAGRSALLTAAFAAEPEPPPPPRIPAAVSPESDTDSLPPDPLRPVGPSTVRDGASSASTPLVTDPPGAIALGRRAGDGAEIRIPLESLRKHTVIFAGSGSGKTVLIRRVIEECALRGVSAIVLDPNNDLARLGDAWPTPPEAWRDGDAERAADYLANTEVVVWTPRRETGRPISFQPLPDLTAVREDPDEFGMALDTAVAALAPRARMNGNTSKAEQGRAVLREALAHFARIGGDTGLTGYVELLAELPECVSALAKAPNLAAEMAETLRAAMINDPMFGGTGTPLDPGDLLTPTSGRRARVSVISLIGLPTNEQRQSFVNQLQMALFAWIKLNPAGDRPLGGLFVMDEAQTLAPSGTMTACTESTLALASQARKYGLGLIFATQAPRGIHNRIVGNAATQLYGFLNSPTQVAAAREIARAKGSGEVEISRLTVGQFYAVGEDVTFQKMVAPMCLTHHPKSALTPEEVLSRTSRVA